MPGRAVCPALGTGGRWTPWHAERAPGASGGANEVGHVSGLPAVAGSGAGLVGGALAAGGRACQHRPARSLHPGRGGRTRLPPRGPLAGPPEAPCSGLDACRLVEDEIHGGRVIAVLGPGPLTTFGVDGFGGADLVEQPVRAVLVEQRDQLFPGG